MDIVNRYDYYSLFLASEVQWWAQVRRLLYWTDPPDFVQWVWDLCTQLPPLHFPQPGPYTARLHDAAP